MNQLYVYIYPLPLKPPLNPPPSHPSRYLLIYISLALFLQFSLAHFSLFLFNSLPHLNSPVPSQSFHNKIQTYSVSQGHFWGVWESTLQSPRYHTIFPSSCPVGLSFSNTCVPTSELCTHGLYQLELNQEKRNHSNDCFWRRERCHLGDPMCWLKGLERISFADTIEHHRPMELGELLLMGTTAKGATGRDIELQHMKDQTLPWGGSIWTSPLAPLVEGWGWGLGLKLKENNQQRCSFSFSPPAQRPSLLIQSAF